MPAWPKALAASVVLAALAGCQPTPAAPVPTASVVGTGPTAVCTPTPGASPSPCTDAEYAKQVEQDKLYAEAERVYRQFLKETDAIARAGGVVTPGFKKVAGEPLASTYLDIFGAWRRSGDVVKGGEDMILFIKPIKASAPRPGSVAQLQSCVDGRASVTYRKGQEVGVGRKVLAVNHFAFEQGTLKLVWQDGEMGDDVC